MASRRRLLPSLNGRLRETPAYRLAYGRDPESRELSLVDGLVVIPLVGAILAFAFYPQRALSDSESKIKETVATAQQANASGGT